MAIQTQQLLYLEALDAFPYDIGQCLEKLQYALSTGSEHAGIHYLMGRVYDEHAHDYEKAAYEYQMALSINHLFTPTYAYYANLLIVIDNYEEAQRVIDIGLGVAGTDTAVLYFLKGILFEKYEMYSTAKECFKQAKRAALNNDFRSRMDEALGRVKAKRKEAKPKESSKKKTKKKKN